ncbi:MAG: DUF4954 family protein [Candidatus Marinimicrobia bacterium]|nr:DUF4954 family protein [Candidatus Neomarinimicrobiota bacterium]MDD5583022.1 DUF4954 family protein [Candidatus Neomarinimicrobiota bacterium]
MAYRNLTSQEIEKLKQQGCSSESWGTLWVDEKFTPEQIFNAHFSGKVTLGVYSETLTIPSLGKHPAGIWNASLKDCRIGDNVLISNVQNLYHYDISHHAVINTVQTVTMTGETHFGNGTELEILNEGGGRELLIYDKLSAQIAYLLVHFRYQKNLIDKLQRLISDYCESKVGTIGHIGPYAQIHNCQIIKNMTIGEGALVEGAILLEDGTLAGCQEDPVKIGHGVIAKHFIVQSGSHIDDGVLLEKCFVGQGVRLGKQYSAEGSAFFANCEGYHGEAVSIFAGPYTVTHHKSTLLIAGMFSFYNAGSGTNQSNHMYKLGPLHQGILERGAKTGSLSYMMWPCSVGAFSVVTGKHAANFDASDFPFSYITAEEGKSQLTPAMNLFTVGTRRDSEKWPSRDRRKDPQTFDILHFDLFNPRTIGKILNALSILQNLGEKSRKEQEFVSYKGLVIKRLLIRSGIKYYKIPVAIYLGQCLLEILEKTKSEKELKEILFSIPIKENTEPELWYDLAGMLIPKSRLETCFEKIVSSKTDSVETLLLIFDEVASHYKADNLSWWGHLLKKEYGVYPSELNKELIIQLLESWKTNTVKLNNMVLKDAEKEFDPTSQIGYGLDGDEALRKIDFEIVRGTYDENPFVKKLRLENNQVETRFQAAINALKIFRLT